MSFIDQLNPTGALVGGFLTGFAQEYLGIQNPLLPILGASAVGTVVSKVKSIYNEQRDVLPGAMTIATLINNLESKIGTKFYTVVIRKEENVIFNKIQNYILHKYSNALLRGSVSRIDNINISLNLENSMFSVPIYDIFEKNNRVVISIVSSNEIKICSKTLDVEGLKRYLKYLLSLRLGVTTITVHQPMIEAMTAENKEQKVKKQSRVDWSSFTIQTNKNFNNTILTKEVHKALVEDLKTFAENEDYYNHKGIPYKRGYLLYGVPGTGKTSIIKAIASFYGMDIYLIDMGDIETEKEMAMVFQGTRTADGYHMLVFEDIDRCPLFQKDEYYGNPQSNKQKSLMRSFLNELDGVIETPKRITLLTANDESAILKVKALCRPGRIDTQIKLGYCDAEQLCKLYNHFSDGGEKLELKELNKEITPAQVVKHILQKPDMTPEEFKKEINIIADIEVKEQKLCNDLNQPSWGRRRSRRGGWRRGPSATGINGPVINQRRRVSRHKFQLKRMQRQLSTLPGKVKRKEEAVKKSEELLQKRIVNRNKKKANLKRKREASRKRCKRQKVSA